MGRCHREAAKGRVRALKAYCANATNPVRARARAAQLLRLALGTAAAAAASRCFRALGPALRRRCRRAYSGFALPPPTASCCLRAENSRMPM